jgi:hypothetical protein
MLKYIIPDVLAHKFTADAMHKSVASKAIKAQ